MDFFPRLEQATPAQWLHRCKPLSRNEMGAISKHNPENSVEELKKTFATCVIKTPDKRRMRRNTTRSARPTGTKGSVPGKVMPPRLRATGMAVPRRSPHSTPRQQQDNQPNQWQPKVTCFAPVNPEANVSTSLSIRARYSRSLAQGFPLWDDYLSRTID